MRHVKLHPPHGKTDDREWNELHADDIALFVDADIETPTLWNIVMRHIPFRHVDALWNGVTPNVPPPPNMG